MNNTVLVTGGAGFVGSHVVDKFCEEGFNVIVVDNMLTGKPENLNFNAKFYNCDITSESLEKIFVETKPDYVVHLAAQISVVNSMNNPEKDASINIMGSINLLKYAKKYGVKKFIAASSAAIYGNLPAPIEENVIPQPMSPYGLSKLTMEKYIELSGLDYLIFRFSNVYGERQAAGGEAGVVTIFENAMKNNLPVTIYGNGEQVRDFVYVKDIAKITFKMLTSNIKNEIVNISTNEGVTINELFESLKHKYGYTLEPIYKETRAGDIDVSILSNKKLVSLIGEFGFCKDLKGEKVNA